MYVVARNALRFFPGTAAHWSSAPKLRPGRASVQRPSAVAECRGHHVCQSWQCPRLRSTRMMHASQQLSPPPGQNAYARAWSRLKLDERTGKEHVSNGNTIGDHLEAQPVHGYRCMAQAVMGITKCTEGRSSSPLGHCPPPRVRMGC